MKRLIILTAALSTLSTQASFFDFLKSHPGANRLINNASNIQFGSDNTVGIVKENSKEQCIAAIHEAIQQQKDSPNSLGVISAASLTSKAYASSLEGSYTQNFKGDGFFAKNLRRGLSNRTMIKVNSFSDKVIPHEISGCSKHSEIQSVRKIEFKGKVCRSITHQLASEKYRVLFCEKDQTAYTDFLELDSKIIKEYEEVK
ncbi:hypothetical protein BIY24_02620 [Halobacteriovorax marinus]|uniref:hypothetical protein n=1 Tax=Halobacteriovorax marinus TaxID=97084 RepID=UPI000BC350ED|nr:hypothetical protein [Halobacteriovorax marinus]ATH06866.1 hypothetical protein BIY24_02620 [Halobacteriovorax marinus]